MGIGYRRESSKGGVWLRNCLVNCEKRNKNKKRHDDMMMCLLYPCSGAIGALRCRPTTLPRPSGSLFNHNSPTAVCQAFFFSFLKLNFIDGKRNKTMTISRNIHEPHMLQKSPRRVFMCKTRLGSTVTSVISISEEAFEPNATTYTKANTND